MRSVIIFLALFGPISLAPTPQGIDTCIDFEVLTGGCEVVSGSLDGDAAVISGEVDIPGTPGSAGASGSGSSSGSTGAAADPPCAQLVGDRCLVQSTRLRPGTPVAPVAPTPRVTLTDIASFRPNPGVQFMEPDGWAVVGLDTNFFAVVGIQVHTGTLFGRPAAVRFTPVAYHWDYGDGTVLTRATPGGTWAALGIPEFGPTPTSHVYTAAGTYVIRLTVEFRAEYRFATGAYIPIAGRLSRPANDLMITAGDAKTVLVERDCRQNPGGPGC